MELMNPIEWSAWLYGKLGHWGFVLMILVVGLIWWRGVELFNHRAEQAPETSEAPADINMQKDHDNPIEDNVTQSTSGPNSPIISGDNNTVNIQQGVRMQPSVEGLTLTARQIPSSRNDAPFAIEVTVQVQADVAPFGLGFVADRPLVGGSVSGAHFNYMEGTLDDAPDRSFWFYFESPSITPRNPLIVTLFCGEEFTIVSTRRVTR